MNFLDCFQLLTLIAFLALFIGRTLWLRRQGTTVMAIGSGKHGFAALLEKSMILFFPVWLLAVLNHALRLDIAPLPAVLVAPLFAASISQWVGVILLTTGVLLFGFALIAFKSSWRVGIDKNAPANWSPRGFSPGRATLSFSRWTSISWALS